VLAELRQNRELPEWPADCRERLEPVIREGRRLDLVLLETNEMLRSQNERIARCASHYDELKTSREDGP